MKAYILVDELNIVRCIATKEDNLHKDKLNMDKYYVEIKGTVGDGFNSDSGEWVDNQEPIVIFNPDDFLEWLIGQYPNAPAELIQMVSRAVDKNTPKSYTLMEIYLQGKSVSQGQIDALKAKLIGQGANITQGE